MVFMLLSIHYLGHKQRVGFVYGILSCICWTIFGILAGSIAGPIANILFIILNAKGYIKWRNSETKTVEELKATVPHD